MSELLAIIKQVLELGWPAIVLVMLFVLWRRLVEVEDRANTHDDRIRDIEIDNQLK